MKSVNFFFTCTVATEVVTEMHLVLLENVYAAFRLAYMLADDARDLVRTASMKILSNSYFRSELRLFQTKLGTEGKFTLAEEVETFLSSVEKLVDERTNPQLKKKVLVDQEMTLLIGLLQKLIDLKRSGNDLKEIEQKGGLLLKQIIFLIKEHSNSERHGVENPQMIATAEQNKIFEEKSKQISQGLFGSKEQQISALLDTDVNMSEELMVVLRELVH